MILELIAWTIVILFSIGLPLLMAYAMGDKHYMVKGQFKRRTVPKIMLNGLLNVFLLCAVFSTFTAFIMLISWAFKTVVGA